MATKIETGKIIGGLSYNDVLLLPLKSKVASRKDADTRTYLTKKVKLNIPIITANMDSVTESHMAIAIARLGGIGIIHRFMHIERQKEEVAKAKRAEGYLIENPYTIRPESTINEARELVEKNGVSGLIVAGNGGKLLGILSGRDMKFAAGNERVRDLMTPRKRLVTGKKGISIDKAAELLASHKVEKLPIVDSMDRLVGLVTAKDAERVLKHDIAAKDGKGRLLVGAAIGIKGDYMERADALLEAEADVLVLDVAHGHSESVISSAKAIKREFPSVQLVIGNVATPEGTRDLIAAGADAVKVGIGPGAACSTRLVTGAGVPQLTAVIWCAEAAREEGIPVIADGGIRNPGDVTKAIVGGASTVMIGSLFAGTDESPGYFIQRKGIKYKAYRGMASLGANISRKQLDNMDINPEDISQIVPEGVESSVPHIGSVKDVVTQLVGGLRSGMSYCGASNLQELYKNGRFIQLTPLGAAESYEKLQ
jgi:IMP dehydrogenase